MDSILKKKHDTPQTFLFKILLVFLVEVPLLFISGGFLYSKDDYDHFQLAIDHYRH